MEHGKILPFYMAYPMPFCYKDEREVVKDMEYLQSQHSVEIRRLSKEIANIVNILDYDGSVIYDEYPDRFLLERQCIAVCDGLRKQFGEDEGCEFHKMIAWDGFQDIVMLLLYDEILKRRHKKCSCGFIRKELE